MSDLTVEQVENAFQPAREITDPASFAGRSLQVKESFLGLVAAGAHVAIVGNRGVGKTSLARQTSRISIGAQELLEKYGIKSGEPLDFFTVYHACGSKTESITDLLRQLLTNSDAFGDWIYDIPSAKREAKGGGGEIGFDIKLLKGKAKDSQSAEASSTPAVTDHDIETVFTNVMRAITAAGLTKHGILIIIDEFDQIRDKKGFASLLKALATNAPGVKFCIVGVASDIQGLMEEHGSVDRLFAGTVVTMPPMADPELAEIVSIAEARVDHKIKFTDNARKRLLQLANGHPYMVHLIGKYAFRAAFMEERAAISEPDIEATLRGLAERGADQVLEQRYKDAIKASQQREIVLRAMAESQKADGEIYTADAYSLALQRGVDNASQYVGNLATDEYGREIEKLRDRFYRFRDSLFRAYVLARPSVF